MAANRPRADRSGSGSGGRGHATVVLDSHASFEGVFRLVFGFGQRRHGRVLRSTVCDGLLACSWPRWDGVRRFPHHPFAPSTRCSLIFGLGSNDQRQNLLPQVANGVTISFVRPNSRRLKGLQIKDRLTAPSRNGLKHRRYIGTGYLVDSDDSTTRCNSAACPEESVCIDLRAVS